MNLFLWVLQAPIMQLLRVIWEEQGRPTARTRFWFCFYGFIGWLSFGVISYAAFRILYYVLGVIG